MAYFRALFHWQWADYTEEDIEELEIACCVVTGHFGDNVEYEQTDFYREEWDDEDAGDISVRFTSDGRRGPLQIAAWEWQEKMNNAFPGVNDLRIEIEQF